MTAPDSGAERGTAGERTSLAWERSGLALAATGAATAKGIPSSGVAAHPALGTVVILLGVTVWVVVAFAERHRRSHATRPTATPADLAPIALATTAAGLVLIALAAWPS